MGVAVGGGVLVRVAVGWSVVVAAGRGVLVATATTAVGAVVGVPVGGFDWHAARKATHNQTKSKRLMSYPLSATHYHRAPSQGAPDACDLRHVPVFVLGEVSTLLLQSYRAKLGMLTGAHPVSSRNRAQLGQHGFT